MPKLNDVRYQCYWDDEDARVTFDTYICRTIRGGFSYWVIKTPFTWGKIAKPHGSFGWLDQAKDKKYYRSLDPIFRERCLLGKERDFELRVSKLSAARYALATERANLKWWKQNPTDSNRDTLHIDACNTAIKALQRCVKRLAGKKKNG